DHGMLYVSDGGVIRVFEPSGRAAASPFNGMRAGATVQISRSFHSPTTPDMLTPAYYNVLPENAHADRALSFQEQDALVILGSTRDDRIDIFDRGSAGVRVVVNGIEGLYTQDLQHIVVMAGNGDDVVTYHHVGAGAKPRDLTIQGGAGADSVQVEDSS